MTDSVSDAEVVVEQLDPEESFELLANEIRLGMLRALDDEGSLAYEDLRSHVGVADSGQFNYHLQKLEGQFLSKDEGRYRITPAGRRVVGAVLSGGYTGDLAGRTVESDAPCFHCGGPLATHLEDGGVYVACEDCDARFNPVEIPPAVLEGYSLDELHDLVDRWVKRQVTAAQYGFCSRCDGKMTEYIEEVVEEKAAADPEAVPLVDLPLDVIVKQECSRCGERRLALVGAAATLHPAVVSFHYEHGIDVRETPLTDLEWLEMGIASVESTDPLVVSVPVTLDDDTLVVAFDEEFTLVDERRP